MKFIQSIPAIMAIATMVVSCQKNKDVITAPPVPVNVLTDKLEACIKFDNNLNDSTGKVAAGKITGTLSFSADRKGNANSALYLNNTSKAEFADVDLKGQGTIAAWVKYSNTGGGLESIIRVMKADGGFSLFQSNDALGVSVSVPNTNSATGNAVDNGWHHLASTYNGVDIKLFVDGELVSTVAHAGSMGAGKKDIVLGFFLNDFWQGSVDELRIYSKVMSAGDIKLVASL